MRLDGLSLAVSEATSEEMQSLALRIEAAREQLEAEVRYAAQRCLERLFPAAVFTMLPIGGEDDALSETTTEDDQ